MKRGITKFQANLKKKHEKVTPKFISLLVGQILIYMYLIYLTLMAILLVKHIALLITIQ